jgi:hypothetical protein
MKPIKILKVSAIIVMLLGSIHLAATPVAFALFSSTVKPDITSVYMFVMVGLAVLFAGGLQYYLVYKIGADKVFLRIYIGSVIFMAILGIGAVGTLTKNPFAYVSLFVAITEVIAVWSYSKRNTK